MKRRDFVGGIAAAGLAGCAQSSEECAVEGNSNSETFEWSAYIMAIKVSRSWHGC